MTLVCRGMLGVGVVRNRPLVGRADLPVTEETVIFMTSSSQNVWVYLWLISAVVSLYYYFSRTVRIIRYDESRSRFLEERLVGPVPYVILDEVEVARACDAHLPGDHWCWRGLKSAPSRSGESTNGHFYDVIMSEFLGSWLISAVIVF